MSGIKLSQVTDCIHDTIFLSKLESEFIATPYIYRLHDVYQSSTVYLTYPSNHTKRYEHSLGTMDLSGRMFFSAMKNASIDTQKAIISAIQDSMTVILETLILRPRYLSTDYLDKDTVNHFFSWDGAESKGKELVEILREKLEKSEGSQIFNDYALNDHPCPLVNADFLERFLYTTMLQAIRLVALFHDAGHPPFSHILEGVLEDLYELAGMKAAGYDERKLTILRDSLSPYLSADASESHKIKMILSDGTLKNSQLHEKIGVSLMEAAIEDIIPEMLRKILADSSLSRENKEVEALYYIMVAEFSMAIFTDSGNLFRSLHTIIDGPLDADRLDYLMRDMRSCGVDWGHIPYKRIINNMRFNPANDTPNAFLLSFPKKIKDDISDLYIMRYKIFLRINFHHRVFRTAAALQSAVDGVAKEYLSNGQEALGDEVEDISVLWKSLSEAAGEKTLKILRWNDSWLVSTLQKALLTLEERQKQGRDCNLHLILNLREFLLNKKKSYALFKRGYNEVELVKNAIHISDITDDMIDSQDRYEAGILKEMAALRKQGSVFGDDELREASAKDSVERLKLLREAMSIGNLPVLNAILPCTEYGDLFGEIGDELDKCCTDGLISSYNVIRNSAHNKYGLPKNEDEFDNIYLHDSRNPGEKPTILDIHEVEKRLKYDGESAPDTYIYIVPREEGAIDDSRNEIFRRLEKRLGIAIRGAFDILFHHTSKNV